MLRLFSSFPPVSCSFLSLSPPQLNLKSDPIIFKDTRQAAYEAQRLSKNSLTLSTICPRRRVNFLVYYKLDRVLCSPFSCPSQSLLCPTTGRLLLKETVSAWLAGARTNTEWRKQLLKNIQQYWQAGRVQFPIYSNIKICGRVLPSNNQQCTGPMLSCTSYVRIQMTLSCSE